MDGFLGKGVGQAVETSRGRSGPVLTDGGSAIGPLAKVSRPAFLFHWAESFRTLVSVALTSPVVG